MERRGCGIRKIARGSFASVKKKKKDTADGCCERDIACNATAARRRRENPPCWPLVKYEIRRGTK